MSGGNDTQKKRIMHKKYINAGIITFDEHHACMINEIIHQRLYSD